MEERRTDLRSCWRALTRHKWLIALVVMALGGAGLASSLLQEKVYQASSQLLVTTERPRSLFAPETGRGEPNRALQTQIGVLESPAIRVAVESELPGAPAVSGKAAGETDIVMVSVESTDPQLAAKASDAYSRAFIDYRRRQAVDSLLAAGREIQKKIDGLGLEAADVEGQLEAARRARGDVRVASLTERRASLIAQQALFRQRLDQLQVDAGLQEAGAQIVGRAMVPSDPIRPTPVRTTVLTLLMGLVVGGAVALLRDRLDDTVKTKEDIEQVAPGLPVLAVVPTAPVATPAETVATADLGNPRGEAYRALRTAIQFMSVDREMGIIQITSPDAGAGKSTILANLAVAMARTGKRVILVCCDLRRPAIHEFFGLDNTTGFTSVLLNEVSLADALQAVESEPNITVLSSGPIAPNASELLSSPATARIFEQLKFRAISDIILVDCPPILPVADAAIISAHVDGTVMVVTAGATTASRLDEAVDLLRRVDAPLLGLVLNRVSSEHGYGYGYGYESARQHGPTTEAPLEARRPRRGPPRPRPVDQPH